MRPRIPSRTAPERPAPSAVRGPLSRRRWLIYVTAGLAALPLIHQRIRRRRRGEPGPTGWFGHC